MKNTFQQETQQQIKPLKNTFQQESQQQNKQLKNTFQQESQQSEALKRSLNLPNIPSSLTLSKSTVPITTSGPSTSILPVPRSNIDVTQSLPSLLTKPTPSTKYPLEITQNTKPINTLPNVNQETVLPSSLMVSKAGVAIPTPKFPADSGISISQVIVFILLTKKDTGTF